MTTAEEMKAKHAEVARLNDVLRTMNLSGLLLVLKDDDGEREFTFKEPAEPGFLFCEDGVVDPDMELEECCNSTATWVLNDDEGNEVFLCRYHALVSIPQYRIVSGVIVFDEES